MIFLLLIDRFSFVLIIASWFIFSFINVRKTFVLAVAFLILLMPIMTALLVNNEQLIGLYLLDENTGIRIEFIRSAMDLIGDGFFLGVGFDSPYRNIYFDYVEPHSLLTDISSVNIVSNHHSLVDIALRLGMPAMLLFTYGVFFERLPATTSRFENFVIIMLACGLSVDAWYENQLQLIVFCFLSALLYDIRVRKGAE